MEQRDEIKLLNSKKLQDTVQPFCKPLVSSENSEHRPIPTPENSTLTGKLKIMECLCPQNGLHKNAY